MNKKAIFYFWIGFLFTGGITLILYRWLRVHQQVTPEPLILSQMYNDVMLSTGSRKPVASKDNLEVIRGIGPTYVQRLNQAGIYSFNDLAGSTTEALKEIIGTTRWDPAEWITEARKLSASSN